MRRLARVLSAQRNAGGSAASPRSHRFVLALVAALACALAIAPGAFASKVIVDSVENPRDASVVANKGGNFASTVTGDAVNATGNGGVGAGDFYVVDSGFNRVQRFTSAGSFIEAWGFDVVSAGPGNGDAIQSLTVDATGGQFKLSFGGDTTPDLAYNATAAQVQSALRALPSIGNGNVTVTGGPGGGSVPYGVFFEGSLSGAAQPPIVTSAGTTPLSGGAATATVRTINAGAETTGFEVCKVAGSCKDGISSSLGGGLANPYGIAVQQSTGNLYIADKGNGRVDVFTATGIFIRSFGVDVVASGKAGDSPAQSAKQSLTVKATGGQFKLSFQGKTTTDLKFDASAAEVQAALQNLTSVGPQGIVVSGGPGDETGTAPYLLTFGAALKDSPQPLVVAANGASPLSGGSATAQVAGTQAGATGAEICTDPADCKSGAPSGAAGGFKGASAITFAPAGAPNAGNLLVTEQESSRVSEFTPAGAFVRAFGFGVVDFGPSKTTGKATAVQSVKIAAASGNFKLSFEGQTTTALPYNASGEEVRNALNALSTIGGRGGSVAVSGGPGDASGSNPYLVTFGGTLAGKAVPQIVLDSSALGLAVGAQVTCSAGPTAPDGITFQWLRDGTPIPGATGATYTFVSADEGKSVQCQAFFKYGVPATTTISAPSVVAPVPTPSPPVPPQESFPAPPGSSGELEGIVSRELTCSAGSWGGSPTEYTYQWLRGGQQIAAPTTTASTTNKITIPAGEQLPASVFQCVVTAKNASGSSVMASGNRHTKPQAQPTPSGGTVTVAAPSSVSQVTAGGTGFETCVAASYDVCQSGVSGTEPGQFLTPTKIAADGNGKIYVTDSGFAGYRMQYFTQAGATITPQGPFAPAVLQGNEFNHRPVDVAIGPDDHVFVTEMYKKGEQPACIDIEDTPETLIHEFDGSGDLVDTHLECSNNSGGGGPFASSPEPQALAVNPLTGRTFLILKWNISPYVVLIDEADGPHASIGAATDVRGSSATLNAEIEPLKGPWNTYYHFELREAGELEWRRQPAAIPFDPVIGNGTGSGSAKSCPDGNPPKCEIAFVATGLRPETEYEVRLMAFTWSGTNNSQTWIAKTFGGHVRATGPNFTTVPSGPTAVTGGASWSSPAATHPSLNLDGQLNAANSRSTFVFEYVTEEQLQASGWANAGVAPKAPARPVEAGRDFINVEVRQSVANLDPTKTYHYRLVATNPNGVDYGQAKVVAPPRDDARFAELISNADGEGMGAASGFSIPFLGVSQDGKRAYFSSQSIGSPDSLAGLNTPFGSDRGPDGWKVFQVGNDPLRSLGDYLPGEYTVASDLSGVLWWGNTPETFMAGTPFISFTSASGENDLLTQLKIRNMNGAAIGAWRMVGGSPNLDTFAFMPPQGKTLLPGEITGPTSSNYFQVTGARSGSPELSLVNQDNSGQQIGGKCSSLPGGAGQNIGGEVTAKSSISTDGRAIYFVAFPGPPATGLCSTAERNGMRIFKRVDAKETVAVSAPTCSTPPLCGGPAAGDVFRGASLDGDVVVFKTNRRITESDKDSTNDVYLYDETPPAGQPKLVQISAGEAVAPSHPTPGTGATTQGVITISSDGSRVYFIASGRLTADATAGASNLYVYQRDDAHPAGSLKYLAKFGAGAAELWSLNSNPSLSVPLNGSGGGDDSWGDGRFLVFQTTEQLLPTDTDLQTDIYRIDSEAATGAIVCMSCAGNGAFPATAVTQVTTGIVEPFWNKPRIASDDGEVGVFWTEEGLIPEDTNGGLDVYAWNHGKLELITRREIPDARPRPSAGTTSDGSVVFYYTAAPEVPSDSNSAGDVYAARIGGGFPTPEGTFVTCLSAGECKGRPSEVASPVSPGSASFVGSDNPAPPPVAATCKKGTVSKGGKCVKKAPKCKKGKVRKGGKCVKKKAAKGKKKAAKGKKRAAKRHGRTGR